MTARAALLVTTPAQHDKADAWPVAAACALGIGGYGFYMALPIALGTMAQQLGFSDQQLGWLGSVELLGMLLGALFAAWALRFSRLRSLAGAGTAAVLVAALGSLQVRGFDLSCTVRMLGGFGAGLAYSVSVVCIGNTAAVTRNFGILNAAMVLAGALELAGLPWMAEKWGMPGVFAVLGLEAGVAVLLLPALPVVRVASTVATHCTARTMAIAPRSLLRLGLPCLLATTLCHVGPAANWAYSERLASAAGLSAGHISAVLTIGSLIGALGCLGAWRLGARWGQHRALLATVLLLALVMLSWAAPWPGSAGYGVRTVLTALAWAVVGVFQQTAVTLIDDSGRLVALVPAAQGIGLAVGPLAGATLLGVGLSLPAALACSAAFLVLSLSLSAWVYLKVKDIDPALANR